MRLVCLGLTTVYLNRDPAARGQVVATGEREETGIPGTRTGRGEGGKKSEVRSLQVSPGEGMRSSEAGTTQ